MKASNAKLSVSSNGEYFPLTQYRVILIKGNVEAINIAQSTLWRIIASANTAKGADETNISGHLLIPEAASGLIIGRAGATIKRIATEAGVQCGLDSKDEVLVGERIMSISGPLDGCIAAVSMVLEKFADDPIASTYVNKTAKYTTASGIFHFGNNGKQPADHSSGQGYSVISAETTIVMQVADSLIGSILGVKGAVLRELEAISGATISVSSRSVSLPDLTSLTWRHRRTELTEESKDRTVTITGEPTKAQAAFILVTQKFNQVVSNSPV